MKAAQALSHSINVVDALEKARRDAMVRGDVEALEKLIHPDLVYQHGTGARQGKAEYIDLIASGDYRYTRISSSGDEWFDYSTVVVLFATLHFDLIGPDGPFQAHRRATLIWVCRDGIWRLEVYQGCIAPGEDVRAAEAAHEPESVRAKMHPDIGR